MSQALVIQYLEGRDRPDDFFLAIDSMIMDPAFGPDHVITFIHYRNEEADGQHTKQNLTLRQVRDKLNTLWKTDSHK